MPGAKPKTVTTRRNDRYEKRLASILGAASEIIARDGFEGASVRDMAARGRIGLSGIYYYFKSKDELLFAIQHHAFSTLVSSLKQRFKTATTPEERLRAVIDNHFQFVVRNMDEFKVCVHEIESLSGKYYKRVLTVRQQYFRLVKEVVDEIFRGSSYETDVATLFLFGSLNWAHMWYDPEKNADIDKLSSQYLGMFLNGIRNAQSL